MQEIHLAAAHGSVWEIDWVSDASETRKGPERKKRCGASSVLSDSNGACLDSSKVRIPNGLEAVGVG